MHTRGGNAINRVSQILADVVAESHRANLLTRNSRTTELALLEFRSFRGSWNQRNIPREETEQRCGTAFQVPESKSNRIIKKVFDTVVVRHVWQRLQPLIAPGRFDLQGWIQDRIQGRIQGGFVNG